MLFMVIERFKDPEGVRVRFAEKGRMLPPGVTYVNSWVETSGRVCYQIMEAPGEEWLAEWTSNWQDLVDFEIIPVMTSTEFNS